MAAYKQKAGRNQKRLGGEGDNDELATNTAVESVDEPAVESVDEPVEEPAAEPAAEPVEEPAAEPVDEPAEEPAEEPAADVGATSKTCVIKVSVNDVKDGTYVEVKGTDYTTLTVVDRIVTHVNGEQVVESRGLDEGATYYKVEAPQFGGKRKSTKKGRKSTKKVRKSVKKVRKSAKKVRKSRGSRRSRK